jgi:hypothetical protein
VKLLNDSFAKGFEACLGRLLRKHRSIAACYLRHSAAHESPNPLLSDFDLIFFVSSANAEELARRRAGIVMDMDRWPVFGRLSKDRIFMPDTPQAYALCRESYPFRSIYPFESWYRIGEAGLSARSSLQVQLPLDHVPESFLLFYLVRTALDRQRRPLERAFIRRKLLADCRNIHGLQSQAEVPALSGADYLDQAFAHEIRMWDRFYGRLEFAAARETVTVTLAEAQDVSRFGERWAMTRDRSMRQMPKGVSSIWVYPSSHRDRHPYVSLNLQAGAAAGDCLNAQRVMREAFAGFRLSLLVGTEGSMAGRINGLGRLAVFEPWLFRTSGICLLGDCDLRDQVIEPPPEQVLRKFREFALYSCYRWFSVGVPPAYAAYRLIFAMAQMVTSRELVLDDERLQQIFGSEYVSEEVYCSGSAGDVYLAALRNCLGIDIFNGNPAG